MKPGLITSICKETRNSRMNSILPKSTTSTKKWDSPDFEF